MTEENRTDRPTGRAKFESVVDDVAGFDFKLPRTLLDLVVRPGRVADAALADDHSRYTRPMRVYLTLFAVMTVAFGWVGFNASYTLTEYFGDYPPVMTRLEAGLAAVGSSVAEADAVAIKWSSWTSWPVSAIASLIFVLAIWLTRPRLGLFKSFMLYLVMSNASSLLALPVLLAGMIFGRAALIASGIVALISFFVYGALVLHRRAADTALGLALRTAALVAAVIPLFILTLALVTATLEVAFRTEIGISRIGLILEAAGPADAEPAAP